MRAVNLLPRETSSRKFDWNGELAAGIAFTVILLVALCGGFFVEQSHANAAKQRLATAQAALDRETAIVATKQTHLQSPAVLSQAQLWHIALDSALSTRVRWDVLLTQLEYVTPNSIRLTNVTFGSPPSGPGGAASASTTAGGQTVASVQISGFSASLPDVAVFLSSLERVSKLTQVRLVNTSANRGSKIQTFQISAQVVLPATPAAPVAQTDTTTTPGGSA